MLNRIKGSDTAVDAASGGEDKCLREMSDWRRSGNEEKKKAAVHAEMERVRKLPVGSNYAAHRMRVLHKVLHLMSIQRSGSEEEELELLFAGLSM
ncbi:hypothetical protein QJS04_geneDACA022554 [Acorus gramineus]|uniref:Uncharacterized protein n=1 Tax=Acorus gramineus TaxID=55184 RepID=A0AAV9A9M0_ACOGR|nr:hypothetical protein QJS04_geneDACA022554 [Acorus gramineus]